MTLKNALPVVVKTVPQSGADNVEALVGIAAVDIANATLLLVDDPEKRISMAEAALMRSCSSQIMTSASNGSLRSKISAKPRLTGSPANHEGSSRANIHHIIVFQLFGEQGRTKSLVPANVATSEENHQC